MPGFLITFAVTRRIRNILLTLSIWLVLPLHLTGQDFDQISTDSLVDLGYEVIASDLDSALLVGRQLVKRYENGSQEAGIRGYSLLGFTYYYQDEYQKAIDAYQQSLRIIGDDTTFSPLKVDIYVGLSSIASLRGEYEEAVDLIIKAQKHLNDDSSWKDLLFVYQAIAQTYYDIGDYASAMKYVQQCEELFQRFAKKSSGSNPVQGLKADLLQIKGQLDSARVLALKELHTALENRQKNSLIYAYEILAAIAHKEGNLKEAISLQRKSLAEARQYGDHFALIIEGSVLGMYLSEANELEQAASLKEEVLREGRHFPPNLARKRMAEFLYKLAEKQGDSSKALEYYKELSAIELRMKGAGFSEELLRSKYLLSKKENDLLELRSTLQQQEISAHNFWIYFLIFSALVLSIFLTLTILAFRNIKRYNRKLNHKQNILNRQRSELKQLNYQLVNANSNKDRLLSILSHDVRQPFNQTIALLQMLERMDMPDNGLQEVVENIKASVKEQKHSIENLLTWSKNQLNGISTKPEAVTIKSLFEDLAFSFRSSLEEKNLSLNIVAADELEAYVDPSQLEIILRNLLGNAIKFSHDGGRIILKASENDGQVIFSMRDFGVGMSKTKLAKLLDDKEHFSEAGTLNERGSGFGMLIIMDFVRQNKGILTVHSVQNEGSEFIISFPAPQLEERETPV